MRLVLYDDNGNIIYERKGNFTKNDIMLRPDYIAMKGWKREDIANLLEGHEYLPSKKNIDTLINSGLLKYLEEQNDEENTILSDAIDACIADDVLDETSKKTEDLFYESEEHLRKYHLANNPYIMYYVILPGTDNDNDDKADIGAALEDTLHRLIENGASDEDIEAEMGLYTDRYENPDDFPAGFYIDLGYFMPDAIMMVN